MSLPHTVAVLAMAVFSLGANAAPVPSPELAEAQLRSINHRFVSAFVHPDAGFMAELVHEDFVRTASDGSWQDRSAFLPLFEKPSMAGASTDHFQVRLFGRVAVTHALFEALLANGQVRKVRYTDVYVWNGNSWRLVSGQNSLLKPEVPVALQTEAIPAHAPWTGADPSGDDDQVLEALNANYVDAFRRADVGWYAAHLAPDYVVVSSDGSIRDRAAALANFAEPVFAEHIRSFPVDQVRIRRFDDIALIHAENAFEMKDGRVGVNRYTDIWHKRDGRWQCIAAHITTHKALAQPG
jgi:uncharacterized protein (TIGR02246 family)